MYELRCGLYVVPQNVHPPEVVFQPEVFSTSGDLLGDRGGQPGQGPCLCKISTWPEKTVSQVFSNLVFLVFKVIFKF